MRKVMKMAAVCTFAVFCAAVTAWAQDNPWTKELPFENGMIRYTISGVETGTETLYIRDHGATTARYHNAKSTMMGMTVEMNTIEFTDADWVWEYDLVEKTGTKTVNPVKYMIEAFNALSKADQKKAMKNAEAMAASFQGMSVEVNATKMLGFSCDRISGMGTTILLIHDANVPLKTQVDTMGMKMTTIAQEVNTDKVSDKYFSHPGDIKAVLDEQGSQMARDMARQQVQMLVEGQIKMPGPGGTAAQQRMKMVPQEDQADMQKAMEMMKQMMNNQQQ